MRKLLSVAALLLLVAAMMMAAPQRPVAQTKNQSNEQAREAAKEAAKGAPAKYVPQAQFCADGSSALCSVLPAYIGNDPGLAQTEGYNGVYGALPTQPSADVQSPFDNMAWQMFVALNWTASAVNQPPAAGLKGQGPRVWQTWRKVSSLFGNSPVIAGCPQAIALPQFQIGSDGKGNPAPNNEEYLQASTNLPLIDRNGNWTLFERRVNDVEATYLQAPGGDPTQTLITLAGQGKFIQNNPGGAQFTSSATVPTGANGSMEIKAAWRIIDRARGDDPTRYFTQNILLGVAGDLVRGGKQFCRSVTVGLVGMHILQRNPSLQANAALLPQWIWATFEHADNAPMAQKPCNVADGCGTVAATNWINKPSCGQGAPDTKVHYSFFNQTRPIQPNTNIAPVPAGSGTTYLWNPKQPHAIGSVTPESSLPQVVRCWQVYALTDALNKQWRPQLAAVKSVFANYMLVGTQWGGQVEPPTPPNPVPSNAVPGMLSNMTLETYIQNYTGTDSSLPGPGSCVSCHSGAPLPADGTTSANFSFLPLLAQPTTARNKIKTAR